MHLAAAAGLAAYGVGGGLAMALSNDYTVLLAMQGLTVLTLALILLHRSVRASKGLAVWIGVLGTSLLARLIAVGVTRGSSANKTAKFRRWDALVTTVGYAAAMGYLMTSVIPGRSVTRYLELTAIGIPSATAASMAIFDDGAADLEMYASLSGRVYAEYTIHDVATDTRAMTALENDTLVVVFAGTDSKKNVLTDLRMHDLSFAACGAPKTRVHAGFLKAWTAVRERVFKEITGTTAAKIAFTGHSLGGALATLAAMDAACTLGKEGKVVTFGAPQVGDEMFADEFNARVRESTRVVNPLDPVPRSLSAQFAHVKGVVHVSASTVDPHDIAGYEAVVSQSSAMRVVGLALPVVYLIAITLAMQGVRRSRSSRGR